MRAAESLGFRAEVQSESTFDDIRGWLDKGVPVLVNWFSRGRVDYGVSEVPDGHWSVVAGLDDTHIYLQDPEIGSLRTIERDDFYRVWFDFRGDHITTWDDLVIRQCIAVYRP